MHDVFKMMLPDVAAQPVSRRRSTRAASDEVPHDELLDLAVPCGSDGALVAFPDQIAGYLVCGQSCGVGHALDVPEREDLDAELDQRV